VEMEINDENGKGVSVCRFEMKLTED